jgi:prolyl 4-hydroxylase
MHDIPFRPEEISGMTQHNMDRDPDAGTCTDLHARCTEWAAAGECENNKAYMCGGSNNLGACRKSCKVCESCRSGDMECINRNRVRGGYWKLDKDELEWLGAGDLWKADMSPEL